MDTYHCEEHSRSTGSTDHGPRPFSANVMCAAKHNQNFRTAFWTGTNLQMTLMCIPSCGDIGLEVHPDTDQFIRVEAGAALVRMGCDKDCLNTQVKLCEGDGLFVPCGTWHNIINIGHDPLKLSSIYAPPHHPAETIHRTKSDAERSGY